MGKKKNKKKNKNNKANMEKTKKYTVNPVYNTDDKKDNKKKTVKNKKDKTDNKTKKEKKKNPKLRLAIKILLAIMFLGMLIVAGIVAGVLSGALGGDFNLTEEELKVGALNSDIYDRDGNVLGTLNGTERRRWIDLENMSEYLPFAFVSIEDERFYSHLGVDIKRTASATIQYVLRGGESSYGGSTITQQLVKNLTKEDDRDHMRKIKEMARAYNLEKTLSKDQILELYLNLIFFGGNEIHGVEMGSLFYFNKSAKDLDLAECAFLAGINTSPNAYIPFINGETDTEEKQLKRIENGKTRARIVLAKMKELGVFDTEEKEAQYEVAMEKVNEGLIFEKGATIQNVYSYHTDAAIDEIVKLIMDENPEWSKVRAEQYLFGGGFKIYTTQNTGIQNILQEEAQKEYYIRASKKTDGVVSQVAMVVIDHWSGQVVATVGGTGEKTVARGKNRATALGAKQTGSSMKPLSVIAPALENGIITAGSVYDDSPTRFSGHNYNYPKNYYSGWKGLSTVRAAIEISGNIVPARIITEMGAAVSIEWLKSAGITTLSSEDGGIALALGGVHNGISPLEMAGAYAAIANNGEYITPTFFLRVEDADGNIVYEPKQEKRRVMTEDNSYILKSILTQPVIAGTATECRISGMDVAAKTGTTDDDYDRWLCGFTPYYTAATWFGYDVNETVYPAAPNPALKFWIGAMRPIHSGLEGKKFERTANIVNAGICRDSGFLPSELCSADPRGSRVYSEVFARGTVPGKRCDVHISIEICNTTGKRANEFCPSKKTGVFITRPRGDGSTNWASAGDAQYMAPADTCTSHTEPPAPPPVVVEKPKPEENKNTTTNNTTNTTTNNTVKNNVTTNNTVTNNTTTNNTVTNTVNTTP